SRKCGPLRCQWKFFVFKYRAYTSARSAFIAPAMSRTASLPKSLGVASGRSRRETARSRACSVSFGMSSASGIPYVTAPISTAMIVISETTLRSYSNTPLAVCGGCFAAQKLRDDLDRRCGVLFHQPMSRVRNDGFPHIRGGGSHDDGHRRAERFLAADREDGHRQRPLGQERFVVDGVLIERVELFESRVHGAREGVELGVVLAARLVEAL